MESLARGCAVAALSIYTVVASAPSARADTLFQVQTAATGVHFTLTQEPPSSIITASLVDDATAYTASAYDASGGSEAQAASIFPGNLVVQGPSLFCSEVFTCPVTPPDYPLLADASYPRRQHAQASADQPPVGSGPLVVAPGASVATAAASGNEGQTSSGNTSVLPGTPAAVTIGASSSVSRVTSTGSALEVHVEALVTGIDVGGLVHIAGVHAVDDVTLRPGAKPVDVPHITISGVTVAGAPASIDDTGIHVAGHNGPKLSQRVAQSGFSLRTVGAARHDTSTVARSDANGLEVDFAVPVSGLPYVPNPLPAPFDQIPGVNANGNYVGHLTLGAVGVVAGANAEPAFNLGGISPLPMMTPGGPLPAGTTRNAALGASAAAPPAVAAPQIAPQRSILRGFLDGWTTDLADLYAVLALGTGALFVGWRATAALRRSQLGRGQRGRRQPAAGRH